MTFLSIQKPISIQFKIIVISYTTYRSHIICLFNYALQLFNVFSDLRLYNITFLFRKKSYYYTINYLKIKKLFYLIRKWILNIVHTHITHAYYRAMSDLYKINWEKIFCDPSIQREIDALDCSLFSLLINQALLSLYKYGLINEFMFYYQKCLRIVIKNCSLTILCTII